jgi:hypothetical protein
LSNSVPIPAFDLQARVPRSPTDGRYTVEWRKLEATEADPQAAPWEIVIEDLNTSSVAARVRPQGLPELDWLPSNSTRDVDLSASYRQSDQFEVARALQAEAGPEGRPADWSVRLTLQSSVAAETGASAQGSQGVDAEFTLPAGQIAIFEVVARQQDALTPIAGLAAYVMAAPDEPAAGRFRCVPEPNGNIAESWRWPWRLEIVAGGNKSAVGGLTMPEPVAKYGGEISMWKALEPDTEAVHGAGPGDAEHPALALRIRTVTNARNLASRNSAVGIGTNWLNAYTPARASSR